MSQNDQKLKIVFADSFFASFDGTDEELQELMQEIQRQVETGEFFENSEPVDEEEAAELVRILDATELEEDFEVQEEIRRHVERRETRH